MNPESLKSLEIVGALAIFLLNRTGSIYGKFEGRLTQTEQREAFECVPFGKLKVTIDGAAETVGAYRKVCFGTDWEANSYGWLEFEKECRANKHPFPLGRFGGKYNSLPL